MATPEQVKLADSIPDVMERLAELKAKREDMDREEVARRERFAESVAKAEGAIRKVEGELRNAGLARQAILAEVPHEFHSAEALAGANLRQHEKERKRRQEEAEAASSMLARRRSERGVTKGEIEALERQSEVESAAFEAAKKKHAELAEALEKAQSAIEAQYASIRAAALASVPLPTVEEPKKAGKARASRGG
jgi:hypothetical protein